MPQTVGVGQNETTRNWTAGFRPSMLPGFQSGYLLAPSHVRVIDRPGVHRHRGRAGARRSGSSLTQSAQGDKWWIFPENQESHLKMLAFPIFPWGLPHFPCWFVRVFPSSSSCPLRVFSRASAGPSCSAWRKRGPVPCPNARSVVWRVVAAAKSASAFSLLGPPVVSNGKIIE